MKIYDVAIVGAGPAGIMAAITAAQRKKSVILIEKNEKIGRKILATGNGRCNITNKNISVDRYHGGDAKFIEAVLDSFSENETINFFESIGVILKEEDRGRVFPRTNQAATVVSALGHVLFDYGVEIKYSTEIKQISKKAIWEIATSGGEIISARKAVLATGGKAAYQFGSSGDGLYFAQKLGHQITPIHAALCPIETAEDWVRELQGIKIESKITSFLNHEKILETSGDAIFTHFGISGPAMMAQSRAISPLLSKGDMTLSLDLYPEDSNKELDFKLERLFKLNNKKSVKNAISGLLVSGLVPVILNRADVKEDKKVAEISKKERSQIVSRIKDLRITVKKIRPLKEAQVTSGGVVLSEISSNTLESKIVPGLYLAGEILDVDGDSGGFNLQWAWASGHLVGKNI